MPSVNKVILIGNLTRDPQLSYLPSQTAVVEFGLATNRNWTSKDGEKKSEACFLDCRAFGRQAETLAKYVQKGSPLYIEGHLKLDQWQANDGSNRQRIRVVIEGFQFLGSSEGGGGQQQRERPSTGGGANPDHQESRPAEDDGIPF